LGSFIRQFILIYVSSSESLRKYPPVPDLIRSVTTEYRVPDTNVVFPKGQTVMIPVYAIQHDPNIYENPEVYDPDRFTPENEAKRNPYSFLPFGEGPRNCIGLRFGMMQARIGMAVLLNNFKFELGGRTKVPLDISKSSAILCPVDGIWLKVKKI
jgi:cytochrome P450 family 6